MNICYTVWMPPNGTCNGSNDLPVINVTLQPTFISSHLTASQGCGHDFLPWVLVAKPGQMISLEMTDFFWTDILRGG
jgi:hypothetical protein